MPQIGSGNGGSGRKSWKYAGLPEEAVQELSLCQQSLRMLETAKDMPPRFFQNTFSGNREWGDKILRLFSEKILTYRKNYDNMYFVAYGIWD